MEPNKILSADILDLVFEHRNKAYGAYELRKSYNRRIRTALIITSAIALLIFLSSFLAKQIMPADNDAPKEEVVLAQVEEEKKPEPPPPPPPKQEPPPKVEMTKFTPPKIVPDQEVKPDELPPKNEDLKETQIDLKNQEGIKSEVAVPVIDEGKAVIAEAKDETNYDQTFTKVEIDAEFPGGLSAWKRYLERNLNQNVASDNGAPPGTYRVVVQFIVDKEGKVSDVKPMTSFGYGLEEEAVRAIRKGPNWTPAIQNGRQVKAYRSQPITFIVPE